MSVKHARLAVALVCLPVGCVDEDTNSALGSFVEVTGPNTATLDDNDGADGVIVDCSSLFQSNVSVDNGEARVDVSFDAGKAGARLDLTADDVGVTLRIGAQSFAATTGIVVVDANDTGIDMRIAVTLEGVTTAAGHALSGQLDCLETTGDSFASSCASACTGGGGGGGGDADSD